MDVLFPDNIKNHIFSIPLSFRNIEDKFIWRHMVDGRWKISHRKPFAVNLMRICGGKFRRLKLSLNVSILFGE